MGSLRIRLLALWIMLVVSGIATGHLLFESFQQTANARLARSEELVARACRDLADRYQFFVAGWSGGPIDDRLKSELTAVTRTALAGAAGVEGGIWQANVGSLGYAFPTYEGTGPKTDLPSAEQNTIGQVNAEALRSGHPASIRQAGRSQVLIVHACPLRGPLQGVTGWTMTRVFTAQGPAYNQLLAGLVVMALTIFGSAVWLARLLYTWSRNIALIERALDDRRDGVVDLPKLARTGTPELDRLVDALNATGERLSLERRRAASAERLAALGRLSAGLAHEIRNPIAAMRLKAENALAVADGSRSNAALGTILQQVDRLDILLRDLLDTTQAHEPKLAEVDLASFIDNAVDAHRELAAAKDLILTAGTEGACSELPRFDPFQMQRALDNLILNAIQNCPPGGSVAVEARRRDGRLILRVADTGTGISNELRERLFEPFVTGRADGTGLGLAIVREIARNHDGEARHVPTPRGATFEIEVPWRPS